MVHSGLTDSTAAIALDVPACPNCGSKVRVVNGLCLRCLAESAVAPKLHSVEEELDELLGRARLHDGEFIVGNYDVLHEIGRGGMGIIYKARHRQTARIVALKLLLARPPYHDDAVNRFRREAEAAASLSHPNILPIHEVGENAEGSPYFTMKFALGGSLLTKRSALRANPRHCVWVMACVARAVHYAHSEGILHRDLKPGNVLLDGWREPMVSDFGLAKWFDNPSNITCTRAMSGTPGYIAPEQANGKELTPAADVYSIGAMLFELLAGRMPFIGENMMAVVKQAERTTAPKLRSIFPSADRELERICSKCLESEPELRYHTAHDLAEDLQRWLEGRPVLARPVGMRVRLWRWARRNRLLAASAAAFLCASTAAAVWWLQSRQLATQLRDQQLDANTIAVLPFLNLESANAETFTPRAYVMALRSAMPAQVPARIDAQPTKKLTFVTSADELPQVARKLHARWLITGTYRPLGDRSRLALRIINGSTGEVAATYSVDGQTTEGEVGALARPMALILTQLLQPSNATDDVRGNDPANSNAEASDLLKAGRELLKQRNVTSLSNAAECFRRAVSVEPKSPTGHALLALSLFAQNIIYPDVRLLDQAEAAARRGIELDPDLPEAHRALAAVLCAKGDFLVGLEEAYTTMELGGPSSSLAAQVGGILKDTGQLDRALPWFLLARQWQAQPGSWDNMVGDCWAELGNFDEAEAAYRRICHFRPELPDGWIGLAYLRLLQGRQGEARAIASSKLANYGASEVANEARAEIAYLLGDYDLAEQLFARLEELHPEGQTCSYIAINYGSALGVLRSLRGNVRDGQPKLRGALAKAQATARAYPNDPYKLYLLAGIEASVNLRQQAIDHLRLAYKHGWRRYRLMQVDPRFSRLADDPQFRALLEETRQCVESMRMNSLRSTNNS